MKQERKMIRPWFRQAAVPWKTTATHTGVSGENRVSTKPGVLQPGSHTYYNVTSLCEDYEMTIAMKAPGYRLIGPPLCRPWTHAMPTVGKLRGQRVRWTRGALDDLKTAR
jgi:poly-beta-1,6-N-acetyl-D-glucosamine synthase